MYDYVLPWTVELLNSEWALGKKLPYKSNLKINKTVYVLNIPLDVYLIWNNVKWWL